MELFLPGVNFDMDQIGRVGNTEKWIQNEMYLVFLPSSCNSLRYIIFPILKDDTILFPEKKHNLPKLLTLPIQCFKKRYYDCEKRSTMLKVVLIVACII